MKALWIREVQAVLDRKDFLDWWQGLVDQGQKLLAVRAHYDELLAQVTLMDFRAELTQKNAIDALYLAGEYEDTAAQWLAEASEIENKSYEAVANFESQRIAVSDLFSRMGAIEHHFLSIQAEVRGLRTSVEATRDREKRDELERLLKRKEADLGRQEKELRESSALYERENNRKMSLWEEVEQMWTRSLDINLGVSERKLKSKRTRAQSERQFKEAEQHKQRAATLKLEAEEAKKKAEALQQEIEELRLSARRQFRCLVGEEFLYWPRRENGEEVYCVPIYNQAEGFNIELKAKAIYIIKRLKGVEFIEPIPQGGGTPNEADSRIDNFFREGRPNGSVKPL